MIATEILLRIAEAFKKNIVTWIAAVGFVIGAAAVGMSNDDFKAAVCAAPVPAQNAK